VWKFVAPFQALHNCNRSSLLIYARRSLKEELKEESITSSQWSGRVTMLRQEKPEFVVVDTVMLEQCWCTYIRDNTYSVAGSRSTARKKNKPSVCGWCRDYNINGCEAQHASILQVLQEGKCKQGHYHVHQHLRPFSCASEAIWRFLLNIKAWAFIF
jgi:hypothetical protein